MKKKKRRYKKRPYKNTFKNCQAEALKYDSRQEFKKKASGCYYTAYRAGWLNRIFPKKKKLTLKECKQDALKYSNYSDWFKKSASILTYAKNKGWYKLCTKHFVRKESPFVGQPPIWTKKMCITEAKKHNSISKWIRNNEYSYKLARRKGWFAKCTKHMTRLRKN